MKKKLLVILGAGSTFFCGLSSVDELDHPFQHPECRYPNRNQLRRDKKTMRWLVQQAIGKGVANGQSVQGARATSSLGKGL